MDTDHSGEKRQKFKDKNVLRGRSQSTLRTFLPFLTTHPPLVTQKYISSVDLPTNIELLLHFYWPPTHLSCVTYFVNDPLHFKEKYISNFEDWLFLKHIRNLD